MAPLGVLEQADGWAKIKLDLATIEKHKAVLLAHPEFAEQLRTIFEERPEFKKSPDPEAQLYDSFLPQGDKVRVAAVRNADLTKLADFSPEFQDERLAELLIHYKARSFPRSLSDGEQAAWEEWRTKRLHAQLPNYLASLQRLAKTASDDQRFLLEELQLWAEAIMPAQDDY